MKALWITLGVVFILVAIVVIVKLRSGGGNAEKAFVSACLQPEFMNNTATCNQAWQIAGTKGISTWGQWLVYWAQHPDGQ